MVPIPDHHHLDKAAVHRPEQKDAGECVPDRSKHGGVGHPAGLPTLLYPIHLPGRTTGPAAQVRP